MKKSLREQSYIFLIISFLVLSVTAVILFFSLQKDPIQEILENDQILDVLFVLHDDDQLMMSDLIMFYPVTKRSVLYDIPIKTAAIWPSIDKSCGIYEVYKQKGVNTFKSEVENLFDIEIPFVIDISLDNFCKLVDLLQGLQVFIHFPVDIRTDDEIYLLPSGLVKLDGDKIRTYLTYRDEFDTESDIQVRNQTVILALLKAISEKRYFFESDKRFDEVEQLLGYNISEKYLKNLLEYLASIDSDSLFPQTITGDWREHEGEIVLFPFYNGQLIKDSCKQNMNVLISSTSTSFSRMYVVQVLNGTTKTGLARNTSLLLESIGYKVMPSKNADSQDYEKTKIIDHINNSDVSSVLGKFILCDNIEVADITDADDELSQVDFTIILGTDFDGRYVRK